MQYFSYINHTLVQSNNLETAVHEYLKENERKVIQSKDLDTFKEMIVEVINNLNTTNHRCKPIKAGWWKFNKNDDWQLTGVGFCRFFLYATK